MCRIAGSICSNNGATDRTDLAALEELIVARMQHGGPDDQGAIVTDTTAFYHCRLSLLDISEAGSQPMRRENTMIVYNGELYNCRELRAELEALGERFSGHSDTEVVLAALNCWGTTALTRFRGMFALALWDEDAQSLLLARDPLGIKPLYYSPTDRGFLFASELKALRELPGHDPGINHAALPAYLRRGYIPAPDTIYQGTFKLGAGEWLKFDARTGAISRETFYSLDEQGRGRSATDPHRRFREHFTNSCRRRLLADVPVGVLLSGGVDSSLIAATVAGQTEEPLRTYTMGFDDPAYDEAPRAAAIARHLNTKHKTFYCGASDFLGVLPKYAEIFDEPFGDASGIATYLLSRGVSADIKCCLGGDGGDELFGGYTKYRATHGFARYLGRLPLGPRKAAAHFIRSRRPDKLARLLAGAGLTTPNLEAKLYKLGTSMEAESSRDFFRRSSNYTDERILRRLGLPESTPITADWHPDELLRNMARTDLRDFVEGDLLVKTDRASMRNGLEVRLPFLDVDLVDFALAQPDDLKLKGSRTKLMPRKLLAEYLPKKLIDGPKKGFAVPLDRWLKNSLARELREMANTPGFSARFGFREGSIAGIVADYLSGSAYVNAYPVWFLYVLYLWHQRWPE